MQLTTITLATILISSVVTAGSDTSSLVRSRAATFEALGGGEQPTRSKSTTSTKPKSAPNPSLRAYPSPLTKPTDPTPPKPAAGSGSGLSRLGEEPQGSGVAKLRKRWQAAPTPESTPAPKPVKAPPTSFTKTTRSGEKPAPDSVKEPIATPTRLTPSPKVSPARTSAAPKPIEEILEKPLFLRPGEPLVSPEELRKRHESERLSTQPTTEVPGQTTAKVLGVTGLRQMFDPSPSSTSPLPKHAPRTSSKPPVPPRAGGTPEDPDFVDFKEKIKQEDYHKAVRCVHILPESKPRGPYAKHLANFTVAEILKMVKSCENGEDEILGKDPWGGNASGDPMPCSEITTGLFIMNAGNEKLKQLSGSLEARKLRKALQFSIKYDDGLSSERFAEILQNYATANQVVILEGAANSFFESNKHSSFYALVRKLGENKLLDDNLVNFASNLGFVNACATNNYALAMAHYGSAKILPSMYAKAMSASYGLHGGNDVFEWLLDHARGDDLAFLIHVEGKGNRHLSRIKDSLQEKYLEVGHEMRYN